MQQVRIDEQRIQHFHREISRQYNVALEKGIEDHPYNDSFLLTLMAALVLEDKKAPEINSIFGLEISFIISLKF